MIIIFYFILLFFHIIYRCFFFFERLHAYWKIGRNLIHPKGYEHRFASLKRGKLVVVALLSDLPPTKHDLHSFAVDLTFYTVI